MRASAIILAALLAAAPAWAQVQPPGPTLRAVQAKGQLDCGGHPGAPGFGTMDSRGEYRGLDSDTCRAIAAAVLGDAGRARFTVLTSSTRLTALQTGQIDVLPRSTTWSHGRDAGNGINFTAVNFYDGQGFLVRRSLGIARARELEGASVCITTGTTSELNLADWARANGVTVRPVIFENNLETRAAYEAGRCDAYTTDSSQLAGIRLILSRPEEHVLLPDIISKEPLGVAVRHGDDQWFDIVRWTVFALIEAEELGVTAANAEAMLASPRNEVRRLLGVVGDHGPLMGLDRRWAYNAIRAVGNYGEMYDRSLGKDSALALPRGLNDLWTRGGLMYAPPIR